MKSKPRVVHLINTLDCGGCENMLVRTLPELSQEFEHLVLTLTREGELTPKLRSRGVRVVGLGWRGEWFDARGTLRLRRIIRTWRANLIITYLYQADLIGRFLLRLTGAPVVPFLRTTYNFERFRSARRVERWTKPLVRSYFAASDAVRDYYVDNLGVSRSRITVIPNGLDLSSYETASGTALAAALELPSNRFVIVCVANLAPYKGHRYLLEAFEQMACAHPNAFLILVGEGEEGARLRQQISGYRARDRVIFLGRRFDVPDILKLADLFVLPTLFEGMSNAILEAMAAGLPVVATQIPENRALITDSVTGRLVAPRDSVGLHDAMSALALDVAERERLGRQARQHVRENHSLSAVAALWSNAIRRQTGSSPERQRARV